MSLLRERCAQVPEQLRVSTMSVHFDHYERGEHCACFPAVLCVPHALHVYVCAGRTVAAHTLRTRLAAQGFYLCCSFCRWDSMSLEVEHLGIEPFVDEKPDQLICAPVRLIPLIVSAAASGLSQPQD